MKRAGAFWNKVLIPVSLAFILLALLPAQWQTPAYPAGITLTSSAQVTFPTLMTFKVNAQSDAKLSQLRVHYIVNRQNFASVVSEGWAQFNPATSVSTQWVWDMRKSPLPPGAEVEYWWTGADSAGKVAQTDHARISFDDNRYKWQSVTNGQINLQWYDGNSSFANSLMSAAQQGLQRITGDVGAVPKGTARIYIYATAQDLQGAQLFAQQWEGGVTFEGFNIIAVGVGTSNLDYGMRAVPHELTHWIVGQVTFNNYGAGLPTWLDEGLATYGEGTVASDYQAALNFAIRNNLLISVRSLSSPFSADPQQAVISYGESNNIATFMIKTYGKAKMIQLLNVFHQGSGYDDALKQVYGFDQDGLDRVWRQSLGIRTSYVPRLQPRLAALVR